MGLILSPIYFRGVAIVSEGDLLAFACLCLVGVAYLVHVVEE
jgi:hypothetical protein